jgi:hypothetical protein
LPGAFVLVISVEEKGQCALNVTSPFLIVSVPDVPIADSESLWPQIVSPVSDTALTR